MGFFKEVSKSKVQTTPFDKKCALQLHEVVTGQMKHRRGWSHERWAKEFRLLRGEIGYAEDPKKLITKVLQWYVKHWQDDGVPKCQSAAMFRKYFHDWLKDKYEKSLDFTPDIPISVEAESMARLFRTTRKWPKESVGQLPTIIQQCITNHQTFIQKLKEVKAKCDSTTADGVALGAFITRLLSVFGQTPHFVRVWMERVYENVCQWEDWNGNLKYFVFRPKHRWFLTRLLQESKEYCGSWRMSNRLTEVLKNAD